MNKQTFLDSEAPVEVFLLPVAFSEMEVTKCSHRKARVARGQNGLSVIRRAGALSQSIGEKRAAEV